MCSATIHWVVKYAPPTISRQKEGSGKKAEDVFLMQIL